MRRVLVIGSGGSGKSTFSVALGERLGLPVVHLDREYWHANWVPTPPDDWRARVAELMAGEAWVMDGNYGGTMAARLTACDTVVFLDLPRIQCLWRVVRRAMRFAGRSRPDMTPGCPERLSWEFVGWIWTYPSRRRPEVLRLLRALPVATRVEVLSSSRAVEAFLAAV